MACLWLPQGIAQTELSIITASFLWHGTVLEYFQDLKKVKEEEVKSTARRKDKVKVELLVCRRTTILLGGEEKGDERTGKRLLPSQGKD